jgi:hypothetical protein
MKNPAHGWAAGLEIAACSDAICDELVSVGSLALWFGDHFISCTFHLAKLVVITLIDAFFAPRHTLVASRQPLARVLFPDVKVARERRASVQPSYLTAVLELVGSAHGLREAAARRLAEAGCTMHEKAAHQKR